jgi:hypothetical protein
MIIMYSVIINIGDERLQDPFFYSYLPWVCKKISLEFIYSLACGLKKGSPVLWEDIFVMGLPW